MPKNMNTTPGRSPKLTKVRKLTIAGVGTLGAAVLALPMVSGNAQNTSTDAAVSTAPVVYSDQPIKNVKASITDQLAGAELKTQAIAAKQAADAAADKKAAAEAAAKKKAAEERSAVLAASRSTQRIEFQTVAATTYSNNLDGWIREALSIMKEKGIPGSYNGLHKNIMRESSGNPNAINDWDINAINGVPSKGLLQVIPPTFKAYHVPGTSWNIYDPVANITAAANYAADRYGSIDNVNSAY
ncbi:MULTISPECIES: transglycosylase SLT domain-containing protein [Streptomyces]|uniref:Lytic transglycosylase n=1 Tax=Streptomyces dengpaensis TaxID=2049881 RepID=A0ABN5I914_9ACTN|nr:MULTISPECIES: transglycosylase SLT domain-containing protein [Streptomyces]AVH59514.1 lytic transglycosylase [Streptomyces dengpaensis]PIB05870.1 lytic transglycosylase [Streptomyces sp. HG99]